MTETRLQEILYPLAFKGAGKVNTEDALNAMKQAVNESLDEAARIVMDNMLPKTSEEITKLKVK